MKENQNTMSRKSVLHIVSSGGLYGAERVILNLSRELNSSAFKPILGVITHKREPLPKIATAAKNLGIQTIIIELISRFDFRSIFRLGKSLKKENISIVHSHGYKATVLSFLPCFLQNVPLIVTCHLWFSKGDLKLRIYTETEALLMKYLPAVIGVSEDICKDIIKKGIKPNKVHVIHNGIDLHNYQKHSKEESSRLFQNLGIQDHDLVIGTIGRLSSQKAHCYLLKAMKKIVDNGGKNIKCVIAGDGKLKSILLKQCNNLNLQRTVFFLGYRKDIINIMERIDIFVLTSIDEGLPMVLLEAMALKKPIISTPVGAIKNVISHNTSGLLYNTGDIQMLSKNIIELTNNRAEMKRLGLNAFKKFNKEYSSRMMCEKYLKIYNSLTFRKC